MPNIKSAKKELRKSVKRQERNSAIITHIKKLTKKSVKAIESKDKTEAEGLVKETMKMLDKAAQKKIIKKNTRDRKKSRLNLKLNKALK
jgi:small subunit ribosomal protein S20